MAADNENKNEEMDIEDDLDALMPATLNYDKKAKKQLRKTQALQNSLSKMMYGGGDSEHPLPQSVQLMEYIITDFVESFCIQAQNLAEQNERAVRVEDFLFLIRKDVHKYKRVSELLEFFGDLKELRKDDWNAIHTAHVDTKSMKQKRNK
mmetsp:Transcript_3020/g.5551  ORF Transcript_3020/g.5551 Transcript_3020/m.5551 type:complete len:150 (+) Transcript_3020:38-487(+)|eukprot:CAMPEP_0202718662 /NCGR_PEP_ID=MMETSP1385-20130828/124292_1 /ASSEMBLY_ACC=CAM_ASM_000861 /TAXON_ID=933848 /ORGANISM="Elphidium margaritaceum" /LENGTH=149 /DNA_ID=CAMNT_0049381491 /DNA_START=21 /DNA_END=470 /DNA_ORIENTATION=+